MWTPSRTGDITPTRYHHRLALGTHHRVQAPPGHKRPKMKVNATNPILKHYILTLQLIFEVSAIENPRLYSHLQSCIRDMNGIHKTVHRKEEIIIYEHTSHPSNIELGSL